MKSKKKNRIERNRKELREAKKEIREIVKRIEILESKEKE